MRNTTKQAKERTEEQKDHAPKQNANVMDWENAAKTVKYFRGAKPEKERFTLCVCSSLIDSVAAGMYRI